MAATGAHRPSVGSSSRHAPSSSSTRRRSDSRLRPPHNSRGAEVGWVPVITVAAAAVTAGPSCPARSSTAGGSYWVGSPSRVVCRSARSLTVLPSALCYPDAGSHAPWRGYVHLGDVGHAGSGYGRAFGSAQVVDCRRLVITRRLPIALTCVGRSTMTFRCRHNWPPLVARVWDGACSSYRYAFRHVEVLDRGRVIFARGLLISLRVLIWAIGHCSSSLRTPSESRSP